MTFSNLWPLGFLILIPVIIILYLLKQKVNDQPFSSTLLWKEIYKNLEAKTPFEKLKNNILMYLQILAMLFLIFALMAPVLRNGGIIKRNTIVVIDTSASMETLYNGGKTRLDEAVSRAKSYVDGLNDSGMLTVISCDDEAQIIYQGQDKSTAKKRLNELTPKQASGNLDIATGMVGSLVSNLDNVDVVCYTDSEFEYAQWKKNNDKIALSVESIYSKEENLSVDYVNYGVKSGDDSEKDKYIETLCKVTNHGDKDAVTDVSLYIGNDIADVQTVTVKAGESEIVYFSDVKMPEDFNNNESDKTKENGGYVLRAEISEKDSLTADNISGVAATSGNNKKVLLISQGNVFMEKALALVDGAEVYKAEDASVLKEAEDFDLYVFDGVTLPEDFDHTMLSENAECMFINYDNIPSGINAAISSKGSLDDIMLHFEKSDVTEYVEDYFFGVTKTNTYELPDGMHPLITADDGSVAGFYGTVPENDQRLAVMGFDIHNTDIALQTEFPIFMSQLTDYLINGYENHVQIDNFPIDESEVIPIKDVKTEGILDKTKTGGRAIRNILLVIAIIILILEWIIYHFEVHSNKKRQYLVVRSLLLAIIVLAIAGVSITRRQRKLETIFLVDVSDSMSGNLDNVENYLKKSMSAMPKKNQAGVVLFGKNTSVEQFISDTKDFYGFNGSPITTATNIESAVTAASSMYHDGVTKRMILITDGCENEGSISNASAVVKNSNVELDVIPLDDTVSNNSEVYIDGLETPSVIHAGDHYNITVSIKSNVETDAVLTLYSGRVSKGQKDIHLSKGSNQFVFEDVGEEGTIAQYKAVIEPAQDTIAVNNTYVTFSQIEAQPKVLVVQGKEGNTVEFEKILTAANIGYDVVAPSAVPVSLSQLNAYKAVITVDTHFDDLRKGFDKTLETYVKEYAGGYICIGGDNSYALGGYRDTALEDILPVDMDIEGEKEIPQMSMVMVIDQSGSMAFPSEDNTSVTGLDLAKQAAISGVNELRESDEAGVLAFDDRYNWTVPITKVGDSSDITDKIRTIGDGGGTSIYPALEEAYAKILNSNSKIKHIILLTDGQDEFREYDALLKRINDAGITVSTVAVGSGSDQNTLSFIANECGGRFYYTDVNNSIPRIFAKEVYLSTNSYLINEEFYPQITSNNEILNGVVDDGCPALLGYIASRAKPRTDVILESPKGDPILSTWQCGLGRTVAWNSDGTNEWTAPFAGWDRYPMLWSNIIHYVISDTDLGGDDLEIVKEGNTAKVIYETEEYDKNTKVSAVISDENGTNKEIVLDPMKPGSYQADVDSDEIGIYNLSIRKKNGEEVVKNYNTAFANQYSPEYQFSDSAGKLDGFVKQVGGEILSLDTNVWKTEAKRVDSKMPLTVPLIILSMFLLLFDIIARRFSIDVAGGLKASIMGITNKHKVHKEKRDNRKHRVKKKALASRDANEDMYQKTTNDELNYSDSDNEVSEREENKTEGNTVGRKVNRTFGNSENNSAGRKEQNAAYRVENKASGKGDNKKDKKKGGNTDNQKSEMLDMNALLQKKRDRS